MGGRVVGRYAGGWLSVWLGINGDRFYASLAQRCAAGDHWVGISDRGSPSAAGLSQDLAVFEHAHGPYVPEVDFCSDCAPPPPPCPGFFERWFRSVR